MKDCPNCGEKMGVQQTVATEAVIHRCRKCPSCGWLVSTKEIVAEDQHEIYRVQAQLTKHRMALRETGKIPPAKRHS